MTTQDKRDNKFLVSFNSVGSTLKAFSHNIVIFSPTNFNLPKHDKDV